MKFSDTPTMDRDGWKLHRAHSMWRWDFDGTTLRALVPCHEVASIYNTTRGTVLHFAFSSPRRDMIAVRVSHFEGGVERGPAFQLCREEVNLELTEDENAVTLRSGDTRVVLAKTGMFGYTFHYKDRLLTLGGERETAYVTDADYELGRINDFNARRPLRPYMEDTYIRESLQLDVGEYVYGFGERFTQLIKNGQTVDIWNRDGRTNSEMAYKNVPFYLSNRGYGVFVNTPDRVEFEVGSANVRRVEFAVGGEILDYVVIGAEGPKEVLSSYTALIGRPALPPAWSFGLWLSTSWEPDTTGKTVLEFIDTMKAKNIPLSVFHFDARWMDDYNCCDFIWSKRYGDAPELLRKIHERGVKVCVWINSYISQESYLFWEAKEKGYLLRKQNGDVWQTDVWMSGMGAVDFTNPAACDWYADQLERLVDMGVDVFKTDFGERIPTDVVYHDGSDPKKMHNYYAFLYNQVVFGLLERKKGKGQACVFSRSSTAGNQQFPVHWGGDNNATYISMAESMRAGLSFCQSGFGFWTHDIAGFSGKATPDLYKRWSAFGLLCSHSRLHGKESFRVPWVYDEESCDVLSRFTRLKCSLMPYLFAQAVIAHTQGIPVMRAMVLEYPDDPACVSLERQYMLGDSLLVAPVLNEGGQVEFYVPEGRWTNYLDGEVFEGGKWYRRSYDYYGLPLLVRPNTVLATGKTDGQADYDYADGVAYQVFALEVNSSAACEVFGADGGKAAGCNMSRTGNGYTIAVESSDDSWSVRLVGMASVKSVQGGTAEAAEGGVILRPVTGSKEITVEG